MAIDHKRYDVMLRNSILCLPGDVAVTRRGAVFGVLFGQNHRGSANTGAADSRNVADQARLAISIPTAQLSQFASVGKQAVSNYCELDEWSGKRNESFSYFSVEIRLTMSASTLRFHRKFYSHCKD